MCGIFSYIGDKFLKKDLLENFNRISERGPDSSKIINIDNVVLGFHRLAINDLSDDGMQPFKQGDYYLICNGEIYNHKMLRETHFLKAKSIGGNIEGKKDRELFLSDLHQGPWFECIKTMVP